MKTLYQLQIIGALLLLCSCQERGKIELNQFEEFFSSKDTINLNYIRFAGKDTNIAILSKNLYEAHSNFDSLVRKSAKNKQFIAVIKHSIVFAKIGDREYGFSNPKYNFSFSFKFTKDSILLNNVDYGVFKSYAIPSQVKIGSTFLDGNITFIKKEDLIVSNHRYHCIVVRWSSSWVDTFGPRSFSFDLWIDPKYFLIKSEMLDSNGNREITFPDKYSLENSIQ